uniref:Uncharacterized protein n=1 Tax=Solanum lycopersicum TaxID=4081 RepID=A0A3Q7JMB0_SOLLC
MVLIESTSQRDEHMCPGTLKMLLRFQRQNTHAICEIWSNGFCLNQQIVSAEPSAAHCTHRKDSCLPDAYKLVLSYNQLDILLLCEFLFTKSCEEPQRFWFLKGGIQEGLFAVSSLLKLKALDPNTALDQIASLADELFASAVDTEIIEQIDRDVKRTHPDLHFFSGNTPFAKSNQCVTVMCFLGIGAFQAWSLFVILLSGHQSMLARDLLIENLLRVDTPPDNSC